MRAEQSKRTQLDADWVLSRLKTVATRCMQEEAVKDSEGLTGEFKFEHSGANKSLELLGKHLGMFTDKVINTHQVDLSTLSDAELNAIAAGKPVS